VKGEKNPYTDILKDAEQAVSELENEIMAAYGIPLFVTEGGRKALLQWPADPDKMSPEEMQVLIDTRGEEAVNAWLAEHFSALAERDDLEGA
jgi:hypothetical protein